MTNVKCKYHTVSVTYRWVRRKGGMPMAGQKLKYSEINLFSCHYVPHKSQATRETGFQLIRWALAWLGSNADSGKGTLIDTKIKARVLHYISGSNCGRIVYLCQTIQAISKVCNWLTGMWNLNYGIQLPVLLNINSFSPVSYNYITDINDYVVKRNEKLNLKKNYKHQNLANKAPVKMR
jgi:hypothetical protein